MRCSDRLVSDLVPGRLGAGNERGWAGSLPARSRLHVGLGTPLPCGALVSAGSAVRDHGPDRDRCGIADPRLLHRLHGRRRARGSRLPALLRLLEPVHLRDADAGARRQPARDVRGLGGRGPLLLPADRVLVSRRPQRRLRPEGIRRQSHRRLRLPARDLPAVLDLLRGGRAEHRISRDDRERGGHQRALRRSSAVAGDAGARGAELEARHAWRESVSSSEPAESRLSFHSTSGCPTRWRDRLPSPPSSTPPPW